MLLAIKFFKNPEQPHQSQCAVLVWHPDHCLEPDPGRRQETGLGSEGGLVTLCQLEEGALAEEPPSLEQRDDEAHTSPDWVLWVCAAGEWGGMRGRPH